MDDPFRPDEDVVAASLPVTFVQRSRSLLDDNEDIDGSPSSLRPTGVEIEVKWLKKDTTTKLSIPK